MLDRPLRYLALISFLLVSSFIRTEAQDWMRLNTGYTYWNRCMFWVDEDQGYVGGSGGSLIRTYDGGATWDDIDLQPFGITHQLNSIYCFDMDRIILVGASRVLFQSYDAGLTWDTMMVDPSYNGNFRDLVFIDEHIGFLSGLNGVLYKTIDAGASWVKKLDVGGPFYLRDIKFVDANIGYVTDTWDGPVHRTEDQGETWTRQETTMDDSANRIYLWDQYRAIAISGYGEYSTTSDGGNSWTLYNLGTGYELTGIHFYEWSRGFMIASNLLGTVLQTFDGGVSWLHVAVPGGCGGLTSMKFPSNQVGYVSSLDGDVYKIYFPPPPLALEEPEDHAARFRLSPNPANDVIHIDLGDDTMDTPALQMYNSMGESILRNWTITSTELNLDIEDLSPGLYFISLYDGSHKVAEKKVIIY